MKIRTLFNNKVFKIFLQIFIYSIVGVFVYLAVKDNIASLSQFTIDQPFYLIPAVILFALTVFVNAVAWHFIMRSSGERVGFFDSLDVYASSYVVRYIPGNVWGVFARSANNKVHGVDMVKTAWGWTMENVLYLMVGFLFSILVVAALPMLSFWMILLGGLAFAVSLFFFFRYDLFEKFFRFILKKILPKVKYGDGQSIRISLKNRAILVLIYCGAWALYSLNFLAVFKSTGSLQVHQLVSLAGINALAWSVGYVSIITPSGTGVREGVMILLLTQLGIAFGAQAVVISLLARLSFVLGDLLFFSVIKLLKLLRGGFKARS